MKHTIRLSVFVLAIALFASCDNQEPKVETPGETTTIVDSTTTNVTTTAVDTVANASVDTTKQTEVTTKKTEVTATIDSAKKTK